MKAPVQTKPRTADPNGNPAAAIASAARHEDEARRRPTPREWAPAILATFFTSAWDPRFGPHSSRRAGGP